MKEKGCTMEAKKANSYERTGKARVLDAITELTESEVTVTRDSLVRLTGLKKVTVDEAIKALRIEEKIVSVERGVYELAEEPEPTEAVSVTMLPRGYAKIEKGDQVMELTPREWRLLAPLAAGSAAQAAVVEHTHLTLRLADQVEKLKRRVAGLEGMLQADGRQLVMELG